jgi:signal transduction histidine kinase/CheY-like chemotaxis protein
MNAATLLALIASSAEILMGCLALAFARAPGWAHFRTFAFIAFSAAAYSAANVVFACGSDNVTLIAWASRMNTLIACLHCAAWIVYVPHQYGESVRRYDRWAIGWLALIAVLSLIPGAVMTDAIVAQTIGWAGVTYHVSQVSTLGSLLILTIPVTPLIAVVGHIRGARRAAPWARAHIIGFSVFQAAGLHEVVVAVGWVNNLYLSDVGFLAAVLSVAAEMAGRVMGDARGLQALSADLSQQVEERTRELTATRDNLVRTERLAALGRLSASIGHEINNPLSYVVGNLEYMCHEFERRAESSGLVEALHDALSGADRIRKIVYELRAFSRGSSGDSRELVDVRDALDAAIKIVWSELRHRARLSKDGLVSVPKVCVDPSKLTQVFVNVLMNAIQAIPEERAGQDGAVITLRTRQLSGERLAIEITDTGVGISEDDRRRLFEPFFSTKPHDKGTGLGLFVSLGIVSAFGGSIDLESEPGQGTTVRIVLPIGHGVESDQGTADVPAPLSGAQQRLLVVDDDVLVARTLARLLRGHSVEVVASGRAALERLAAQGSGFDLVLCDLMMPELTGMDVYEEVVRRHPRLADRFVFISGGGVTERSRRFIELHADRVLSKPIDSRQLSELMAKRVDANRLTPPS